ncbi:MAG: folate-binding protein YgfZ [Magnetococcales bacterium]|nr:folate-binding protein YgfZ [Magnetococcales bacterium]
MSLLRHHLPATTVWCDDQGRPIPAHFNTDVNAEHAIVQKGAALVDLTHCGSITLAGAERVQFLNGLVTNQVKDVTATRSVHASLLTPQGRFLWDFTLVAEEERLHLLTEPGRVAPLLERLAMYRLRAKVEIARTTDTLGQLALIGPEAGATLAGLFPGVDPAAPLGTTVVLSSTLRLWRDPRHVAHGWRLLAPAADLPALWDRLATLATPVGVIACEGNRIRHGLPRGAMELIPEETLPLEAGGKELNGVSFTKGCYVGQETTARTHGRGTVKWRLHQLLLPADADVALRAPVLTPRGKEAGSVTSYARLEEGGMALAMLRRTDVLEHPFLTVDGIPVTVQVPPWATWE